MSTRSRLGLLTVLATAAFLVLAGPAAAASPWWHLSAGSRPAYIDPGAGTPGVPGEPEVQEVSVPMVEFEEPESADVELKVGGTSLEAFCTPESLNEEFCGGMLLTAANVEHVLEGPYGAGKVHVAESRSAESIQLTIESNPGVAPLEAREFLELTAQPTVAIISAGKAEVPAVPDGEIYATAVNLGTADVAAGAVIKDVLPPGLEAVSITATEPEAKANFANRRLIPCEPATLSCTLINPLPPYDSLEMRIAVNVKPGASSGEINRFSVSGGGAAAASLQRAVTISSDPVPFGVEEYEMALEEEGGAPATRAGSHPFQFTTQITLNQGRDIAPAHSTEPEVAPPALGKDFHFKLPPGLIGNPSKLPQCTVAQFYVFSDQELDGESNLCPPDSAVGVAVATVHVPNVHFLTVTEPIYNLEPGFGEPARFGFNVLIANAPVIIDSAVRSDGDYGIDAIVRNINQSSAILSSTATFWGTPADPRHDGQRGYGCLHQARGMEPHNPCPTSEGQAPAPFFSLPTRCDEGLSTSVEADTWTAPTLSSYPGAFRPMTPLLACNQVPFAPEIEAEPTSDAASSPTGLSFDIDVKDEGLGNFEGTVQSQIKKAVVTLPEGFTTNPSVAEGLHACTIAQYEAETVTSEPGAGCPNESKVGDVEVESPLIAGKKVLGSLYVAAQTQNPNHNLLSLYLVARNREVGVIVKQVLKVTPDPVTGQLTTEVDNIPQLPFSHFHLAFRQGQRSPLITPPTCGTYTVSADLYPWSNPEVALHRESSFAITEGPEGLPCPSGGVPPFHPQLLAGSENPTAGAYSPFKTRITRRDSEQEITRFSIKLPPGEIGKLAGVGECSDAQVAAAKAREVEGGGGAEEANPSCPAASQIGHSNVGSGVGNVLAYAPGKLYLAGPYHGSNISIVSITAAKVGPFDLGTVVVRFALRIDPETAEVFVDSQGSDPIPHIVDGIPVHLRDIQAFVDRPDFTLNPTSCKKKSTASTVLGSGLNFASEADDQPVTVTSPFQVASCASLGFKPKLALSLKGGTKRGATPAFKAVLTYPKGSYANIAKSVVTLPHSEFLEQSHIKTICTRVQFKEGKVPGEKCPAASVYGRAEARTPLLDEPLKGPVYLRSSSHNLPDLVAALHNNQVDFALAGRIDSVRNGRIRNTFETVPDAPVSKFVLEMQGGKKGLLVNSTNLCKQKNRAISEFTGQNGKLYNTNPVLQAKCGGKDKKKSKAHKGGRAH